MRTNLTPEIFDEIQQRIHRSKNVIITGLQHLNFGSIAHRKSSDEDAVHDILNTLEEPVSDVKSVQQIGKNRLDGKKMIKVGFNSEEAKQRVLRKAKLLRQKDKYKSIFINPDRTIQ